MVLTIRADHADRDGVDAENGLVDHATDVADGVVIVDEHHTLLGLGADDVCFDTVLENGDVLDGATYEQALADTGLQDIAWTVHERAGVVDLCLVDGRGHLSCDRRRSEDANDVQHRRNEGDGTDPEHGSPRGVLVGSTRESLPRTVAATKAAHLIQL